MRKRAMTWNVWVRKFQPIKNRIDKNAGIDGFMFETYGQEVKAVKARAKDFPTTVWTLLDNDTIIPGWHFVNRLGYFITEKAYSRDEELWVKA
jgi:hypothetical protein